jgi:signal transduction histidine kinase
MTPTATSDTAIGRPVTLDDVKHKALAIRNEISDEARRELDQRGTQIVLIGAAVVVAVIGIAYFAGVRAARRDDQPRRR